MAIPQTNETVPAGNEELAQATREAMVKMVRADYNIMSCGVCNTAHLHHHKSDKPSLKLCYRCDSIWWGIYNLSQSTKFKVD